MYVIGSETMRIEADRARPDGVRHAVDTEGTALCTGGRVRYLFPALHWPESMDAEMCDECVERFTAPASSQSTTDPDQELAEPLAVADAQTARAVLAAVEAQFAAEREHHGDDGEAFADLTVSTDLRDLSDLADLAHLAERSGLSERSGSAMPETDESPATSAYPSDAAVHEAASERDEAWGTIFG